MNKPNPMRRALCGALGLQVLGGCTSQPAVLSPPIGNADALAVMSYNGIMYRRLIATGELHEASFPPALVNAGFATLMPRLFSSGPWMAFEFPGGFRLSTLNGRQSEFPCHGPIDSVCLDPAGLRVASLQRDKGFIVVSQFDISTQDCINKIRLPLIDGWSRLSMSPKILCISSAKETRLHLFDGGEKIAQLALGYAEISRQGDHVAGVAEDKHLRIVDAASLKTIRRGRRAAWPNWHHDKPLLAYTELNMIFGANNYVVVNVDTWAEQQVKAMISYKEPPCLWINLRSHGLLDG